MDVISTAQQGKEASMPVFARGCSEEPGLLSSRLRHACKDGILATLNKLGERDTQQTAVEELRRLITVIR